LAKLFLDNDQIAEEYFSNAHLLGIQCPVEPHKFIWLVNRHFGFDFRYQPGSEIELTKKGRKLLFPVFGFDESHLSVQHLIYTNQFDGEYLLPELKFTDFLWLVRSDAMDNQFMQLLATELRAVSAVQLVTMLANDKIKNKQHLIL
jgi:hypothetical protein